MCMIIHAKVCQGFRVEASKTCYCSLKPGAIRAGDPGAAHAAIAPQASRLAAAIRVMATMLKR